MEAKPLYVVEKPPRWPLPDLAEIWSYRDLMLILCWRELRLRYRQTALGVIWVILQPLLAAAILAVVFSTMVRHTTALPYPLIVFTGVILWSYFGNSVQRAGNSVVLDAKLVTRVYFPRVLVPMASVAAALADFAVSLVVLAVMLTVYRIAPTPRILLLPVWIVLGSAAAIGVGLWTAALNVKYRDFMYAAPFLLQVWMYASPVVYQLDVVPPRWRTLLSLNPLAGFIEAGRWSILGTPWPATSIAISAAISALFCLSGTIAFRRMEREFADVI